MNAALGRVVASVPKAKVMAVYDSVKAIMEPGAPAYMKSLVNGPDAEKAYSTKDSWNSSILLKRIKWPWPVLLQLFLPTKLVKLQKHCPMHPILS